MKLWLKRFGLRFTNYSFEEFENSHDIQKIINIKIYPLRAVNILWFWITHLNLVYNYGFRQDSSYKTYTKTTLISFLLSV